MACILRNDLVLRGWQTKTPKIMSTLELWVAVAGVYLLALRFPALRTFAFVDNEAARASMISFAGSAGTHACMLRFLSKVVQLHSVFLWTARVPSASNPADRPSREKPIGMEAEGFVRLMVPWDLARHSFVPMG